MGSREKVRQFLDESEAHRHYEGIVDYALTYLIAKAEREGRTQFAADLSQMKGEYKEDFANAVALTEQGYHTVYYLPKREIRMELFVPSAKQTVCPHKGMASYWSLETANAVIEDAAWSYEHPHADVAAIAGMLAFSPEKIDAIEATSAVPG